MKDHLSSVGGITSFVVTDDLITLGVHARRRYGEHLEEKRRETEKNKLAQKRKPIEQEIDNLIKRKKQIQVDKVKLLEDGTKALDRAEALGNLAKLANGNALRRSADEKGDELKRVCSLLAEKQELLQNTGV